MPLEHLQLLPVFEADDLLVGDERLIGTAGVKATGSAGQLIAGERIQGFEDDWMSPGTSARLIALFVKFCGNDLHGKGENCCGWQQPPARLDRRRAYYSPMG